ncbi:hypothetical protein J6590_038420 [Homalodisca vitripennis]|nr:hypothetical protein J6590_038420 [Homalodisca vitripennis]
MADSASTVDLTPAYVVLYVSALSLSIHRFYLSNKRRVIPHAALTDIPYNILGRQMEHITLFYIQRPLLTDQVDTR